MEREFHEHIIVLPDIINHHQPTAICKPIVIKVVEDMEEQENDQEESQDPKKTTSLMNVAQPSYSPQLSPRRRSDPGSGGSSSPSPAANTSPAASSPDRTPTPNSSTSSSPGGALLQNPVPTKRSILRGKKRGTNSLVGRPLSSWSKSAYGSGIAPPPYLLLL
uniref:Uncharacterized protein n=1 Tax=Ditylenchus dipsaci TaxID=166011 RepID=A0A915DEI3_9BILA